MYFSTKAPAVKHDSPSLLQVLKDRLIMGHYPLGEKLRSALLADEFGLSPNTVREAMLRLAGQGLLEYEDQRGFRVPEGSAQRLHDIAEFRILLEQQGAARSIGFGGIEWEAGLTAAHHKLSHIEARMTRAADVTPLLKPWTDAEQEFHMALIAAANLSLLTETFATVYARFRQMVVHPEQGYSLYGDAIAEHQRILEAALDRNSAACQAAIFAHFRRHLILDFAPA